MLVWDHRQRLPVICSADLLVVFSRPSWGQLLRKQVTHNSVQVSAMLCSANILTFITISGFYLHLYLYRYILRNIIVLLYNRESVKKTHFTPTCNHSSCSSLLQWRPTLYCRPPLLTTAPRIDPPSMWCSSRAISLLQINFSGFWCGIDFFVSALLLCLSR